MKKRKVIDRSNLPNKIPIGGSLLMFLVLERFSAPEWLWGVFGLIYLVLWIAAIIDISTADKIDIFKSKEK